VSRLASNVPLLAVSGSQRPYIYDLPHLVSLPKGLEFRFRYRYQWVEDALRRAVDENATALVGREIIFLFHSQDSKRIVPIRRARILGIESIGPMVFIRFRVGEFVRVDLDIVSSSYPDPGTAEPATEKLSALAEELLGHIGPVGVAHDLSKQLPPGWYFRTAQGSLPVEAWDRDDPAMAWARLAAVLHREPSLSGIPLFYLLGFRTEGGVVVGPAAVKNRFSMTREEIYGFRLVEAERYRMRVLEWCEPPPEVKQPPVWVNCEFNATHLALEGSSNLVVGRYDVIEFTFSALQPGYSEIALRAEPLQEQKHETTVAMEAEARAATGSPAWAEWPAVFVARVPVVVRQKARRLLVPVISLAVGLILYLGVAPKLTDQWKRVLEVLSLGFLIFGYGAIEEHVERLYKLSAGIEKLRGREWAKTRRD
jgi:hypothetical protein